MKELKILRIITAVVLVLLYGGRILAAPRRVSARDIHVAKTGDDQGRGTMDKPFLTISRAARLAMPGDTIIVHAGTYREWVKPSVAGELCRRGRSTVRAC